jgi:predicted ester cyclase
MEIEPPGTEVEVMLFEFVHVVGRQIIESWGFFDAFGLMQQLDVVELLCE